MTKSRKVIPFPVAQWPDLNPHDIAAEALSAQQRKGRSGFMTCRAAALEMLNRRMRRAGVPREQHQEQMQRWLYEFDEACWHFSDGSYFCE